MVLVSFGRIFHTFSFTNTHRRCKSAIRKCHSGQKVTCLFVGRVRIVRISFIVDLSFLFLAFLFSLVQKHMTHFFELFHRVSTLFLTRWFVLVLLFVLAARSKPAFAGMDLLTVLADLSVFVFFFLVTAALGFISTVAGVVVLVFLAATTGR